MRLDDDTCYAALTARDPRFDGLFFVGVATTGIYCRPVCPARTPGRARCSFYASAAEAERAGFRACFRCRPELAPGTARGLPELVARAVEHIEAGFLDERGVDELAAALGVTGRHLRRALEEQIGVSPAQLAQSRRLAMAKRLLQDSGLGLAEIAFASGFRSVRRFNAAFRERFGRPPTELRRAHGAATEGLVLRLDHRAPLDWPRLLAFLRYRAVPGVERVDDDEYRRVLHVDGKAGVVRVTRDPGRAALRAEVSLALAGALPRVVADLRRLFDLDARPDVIDRHLARDPWLRPLVRRRPGLRLPGVVDPLEAAARAIAGQQVSVKAATTIVGRIVARFGAAIDGGVDGATHRFPTPAELAAVPATTLAGVGLPRARAVALHAVATALASGELTLRGDGDGAGFVARLRQVPGIGAWTAEYLAMRALRLPDAFPAGDLGVRRALGDIHERQARARAEAWRPWRSYAVVHLWTALSEGP
jgi:AraC family transcriptional regulator of adaptative response / DNA-3-methyladenine glycosylase II